MIPHSECKRRKKRKILWAMMLFLLLLTPATTVLADSVDDEYAFEKDLSLVNPMQMFEENSKKVASILNDQPKPKVIIDKDAYQLINEFAEVYFDGYLTENMPDMDGCYELSNHIRQQNKLSIEAFVYKDALTKSNHVEAVDYTITVAEAAPVTENVQEVIFYLKRTFHTNEGDERGGTWFLTQIANTENGYKILNVWIQNYEFEMMQNHLKDNYLAKNIKLDKDVIRQDILNAIAPSSPHQKSPPTTPVSFSFQASKYPSLSLHPKSSYLLPSRQNLAPVVRMEDSSFRT